MADHPTGPPRLSLPALFLRFLRFGLLAWGGPVAQIAMLREHLVERDGWVDGERFNRVLAVYQALPGPEATELCIWFGQSARGRLGGLVAGTAFVLPGFALMLGATWAYIEAGPFDGRVLAALAAMQAAAVALVARGGWKIGRSVLKSRATVAIAVVAAAATVVGVHVLLVLPVAGVVLEVARRRAPAGWVLLVLAAAAVVFVGVGDPPAPPEQATPGTVNASEPGGAPLRDVAVSGLQAGSLTFGGAYAVIPYLQHDAVEEGRWLTDAELAQGLALGSVLPAPLIIFATFVGWLAAGPVGALVMTVTIFLPAFVITLAGHRTLERIVDEPRIHDLLDGITAGVVGLIAVVAAVLAATLVTSWTLVGVLGLSAVVLWRWSAPAAIPAVMAGAALLGAVAG